MLHEPAARGLLQASLYAAYAVLVSYYIHDDALKAPPGSCIVLISECLKALFAICSLCLCRENASSYHAIQQPIDVFDVEDYSINKSRDQVVRDTADFNSCCTQQHTPAHSRSEGASTNTSKPPVAYRVLVSGKRRISLEPVEQERQLDLRAAEDSWPLSLLRFTPVALAYCISDNISVYALGLLLPYSYAVLCTLKFPATAVLASGLLHFKMDLNTLWNLGFIVLGACIGHLAAYRAILANSAADFNSTSFIHGSKVLLCTAALSAAASTYHEMLRRQQQQYSMDFNNGQIQIACLGTFFSFVYCCLQPYGLVDALRSFRAMHWAAAAILAAVGMLAATSAPSSNSSSEDGVIMHPAIFKMYGLVFAPLITALACRALRLHLAPLLFFIGAGVSIVGLLRIHYAQSHGLQQFVDYLDQKLGDCGGWRPVMFKIWKYALYVKVCVLVLLPLLAIVW